MSEERVTGLRYLSTNGYICLSWVTNLLQHLHRHVRQVSSPERVQSASPEGVLRNGVGNHDGTNITHTETCCTTTQVGPYYLEVVPIA